MIAPLRPTPILPGDPVRGRGKRWYRSFGTRKEITLLLLLFLSDNLPSSQLRSLLLKVYHTWQEGVNNTRAITRGSALVCHIALHLVYAVLFCAAFRPLLRRFSPKVRRLLLSSTRF
jgi:hypothetical protein